MNGLLVGLVLATIAYAQVGGGGLGGTVRPSPAYPRWSNPYNIQVIANGTNGCVNALVGPVVFTGAGLNDATSGGTYTATTQSYNTYTVIIDGTGVPDTFKWRKNAGSFTETVAITGSAQALTDGVTVTFAATTGHLLTDQWVITAGIGCWQVNGVLGADKEADAIQTVVFGTLPANTSALRVRAKNTAQWAGTFDSVSVNCGNKTLTNQSGGFLTDAVADTNIMEVGAGGGGLDQSGCTLEFEPEMASGTLVDILPVVGVKVWLMTSTVPQ